MKPLNRWTRAAGAIPVGGAVLSVALFGAAPAAHGAGVTNPAANPAPITVTIGGQTYKDGEDTLPGYDDTACTPIPNVQYDFAENQIQYYDDDGGLITTASWTEWDRISSYRTWLSQQNPGGAPRNPGTDTPRTPDPAPSTTPSDPAPSNPAPSSPAPTSTTPATTSPSRSAPARSAPSRSAPARSTPTRSARTRPAASRSAPTRAAPTRPGAGSSRPGTGSGAAQGTTPGASDPAASSRAGRGGAAAKSDSATDDAAAGAPAGGGEDGDATAPGPADAAATTSPETADDYELASSPAELGDTRSAGQLILAALAAVVGLAFLLGFGKRSLPGRRS